MTTTRITFYRSRLCPRCHVAGKHLRELAANDPSLEIEEIEVLLAPRRAWQAGIRMIPALEIDNRVLSGVFLGREAIAEFIAACTS